ncbi:MAG: NAD-dependent epimerase/dehydratase family protein, partial [Gemmatimonas sp.]
RAGSLRGDITDPDAWDSILEQGPPSVDHVVLCVAPARSRGDSHASTYPAAARGEVRLAHLLSARTITYTSSTGVYGVTDGSLVTEDSEIACSDDRCRALLEAEEAVLHQSAEHEMRRIVLRVAGLYGPGRDPAARLRQTPLREDEDGRWRNFAWRDDVTAAVLHLQDTRSEGVHPEAFNCADGMPVLARDIRRWLHDDGSGATSNNIESGQRVSVDKLRETGWSPLVTDVFQGLSMLGHVPASGLPCSARAPVSP